MFLDEEFSVNHKTHQIWKKTLVSKRKIKFLTETEVQKLIFSEEVPICINYERDRLDWVEGEKSKQLWEELIKDHIAIEGENDDLDKFKNGYFFFAELWKMKEGKKLIVLFYHD